MSNNDRKLAHIELTSKSQTTVDTIDSRFDYEPLLSSHNFDDLSLNKQFLGKQVSFPIWISSMTGGTGKAKHINENLYKVASKYGLGMGLGSCRKLLSSDEYLNDFKLGSSEDRSFPFWANLGVAQVQELLESDKVSQIEEMLKKVNADGLIIHVNPTQEWFQPEGDSFKASPIDTITNFLSKSRVDVIVKEVGQGMGPRSLELLMRLPIKAIEFAAFGGTNFATLETLRDSDYIDLHDGMTHVGHSALDMVNSTNKIIEKLGEEALCQTFIISGGVRSYLDGYYLLEKSKGDCVFAMASPFLYRADQGYEVLDKYVSELISGLKFAKSFLFVKE